MATNPSAAPHSSGATFTSASAAFEALRHGRSTATCGWTAAARRAAIIVALLAFTSLVGPDASAQVYRWVDADGVIHLSSEKPPPGVKAERIDIPGSSKRSTSTPRAAANSSKSMPSGGTGSTSAAQVAERETVLGRLRNRECVIALEALERKTGGAEPTSAEELRRLKQTMELNCSQDPARRREQERQATQLRMANSPSCTEARNRLADMTAAEAATPRDQLRTQQAFVDEHCTPPVR
jgi:hypothetical protein